MRGPVLRYIVAGYLTAVGAVAIVPSSVLRHIPHWGRYTLAGILAAPAVALAVLIAFGGGSSAVFAIKNRRGRHRIANLPAAPAREGDV